MGFDQSRHQRRQRRGLTKLTVEQPTKLITSLLLTTLLSLHPPLNTAQCAISSYKWVNLPLVIVIPQTTLSPHSILLPPASLTQTTLYLLTLNTSQFIHHNTTQISTIRSLSPQSQPIAGPFFPPYVPPSVVAQSSNVHPAIKMTSTVLQKPTNDGPCIAAETQQSPPGLYPIDNNQMSPCPVSHLRHPHHLHPLRRHRVPVRLPIQRARQNRTTPRRAR